MINLSPGFWPLFGPLGPMADPTLNPQVCLTDWGLGDWGLVIWLKICHFGGLGGPYGLYNHQKKMGGETPHLFGWFQSPQGPPRPPK
jgi:hypothetical protein